MMKFSLALTASIAAPLSAQQPAPLSQTAPAPAATAAQPAATPTTPSPQAARPAVTSGAGAATAAGTTPTQVAEIVAREFPSYDRNRDGALDQGEFGEWMVKLKTIADPASTANADANKTWVNAAFAQADADKSRSLTLGELTGFLQQG